MARPLINGSGKIIDHSGRNTAGRPGYRLYLAALAGGMALVLNGCLINRMVEVKEQFCEFDSNFSLDFAEPASFNMHHPVLLDRDILWLSDAEPTELIDGQ